MHLKDSPECAFIGKLLETQLQLAEYACDHDGMKIGELTYWSTSLRIPTDRIDRATLAPVREMMREEFEDWLDPDNPLGVVRLAEMAGFSDETIRVYCSCIRDKLCGRLSQLDAPPDERMAGRHGIRTRTGFIGVYPEGSRWYAQITNTSRGVRERIGTYDTKEEAAIARDKRAIEAGYTWTRLNILSWEGNDG